MYEGIITLSFAYLATLDILNSDDELSQCCCIVSSSIDLLFPLYTRTTRYLLYLYLAKIMHLPSASHHLASERFMRPRIPPTLVRWGIRYASTSAGGWETVIGLEIHAQIRTGAKLFSRES